MSAGLIQGIHRSGFQFEFEAQDIRAVAERLIDELCSEESARVDLEHSEISVVNQDGWFISAKISGLVVVGNTNANSPSVYRRDLSRSQLIDSFVALAANDLDQVLSGTWYCREQLPPLTRYTYLLSAHPLKTELHKAVHLGDLKMCRRALEAGANLEAQDENGATPLHCAVLANYPDVCDFLVRAGADISAEDENGETPSDYANGDRKLRQILSQ